MRIHNGITYGEYVEMGEYCDDCQVSTRYDEDTNRIEFEAYPLFNVEVTGGGILRNVLDRAGVTWGDIMRIYRYEYEQSVLDLTAKQMHEINERHSDEMSHLDHAQRKAEGR